MKNRITVLRLAAFLFLSLTVFCFGPETAYADQSDALKAALSHISETHYSRNALIGKLESEGFTHDDAVYAVNNIYVDWYQMAVETAADYLSKSDYSYNGLVNRLESSSDGFFHEEAVYAADVAGKNVDWNEMAAGRASFYLKSSAFSKAGLIRQLESEMVGFTHEQAVKGVEIISEDLDWKDVAVRRANNLLETGSYSEAGLMHQLESDSIGFTHEEAAYAVETVGADIDWNEQAVKKATAYLQAIKLSRQELIEYLESPKEGFTHDQALFGVDNCGASWSNMIEVLSENLDNLFPIRALEDKFFTPMQALYSDIGPDTAIETSNQNGLRTIKLFANSDGVHDHQSLVRINSGSLENFMFTMDITLHDIYPAGQAGCFIGYVNDLPAALNQEEKSMVLLMADGKGIGFYRKIESEDTGSFVRLSELQQDTYTLSIVRFTGKTYAYIDGLYAGQFQHPENGPFQIVYGVSVLAGGDDSSCSFDNMFLKRVNN